MCIFPLLECKLREGKKLLVQFAPVIYCCITNHQLKTSAIYFTFLQSGQNMVGPACLCFMWHQLSGLVGGQRTHFQGLTPGWPPVTRSGWALGWSCGLGPRALSARRLQSCLDFVPALWLHPKGMCPKRTRWQCLAFYLPLSLGGHGLICSVLSHLRQSQGPSRFKDRGQGTGTPRPDGI